MWKRENLRKNFLRVKQIADQNLGRAEKSEVLTEDQQGSEKRVDTVRLVTNNLLKKVTALLEAPPGTDVEKRLKKLPETGLSHTLIESAGLLGQDTLMGAICQQCGECESSIAREELQCELDIEKDVLTHLQYLAEIEIPSILKLRKQLTKSTLDMDSAKTRYNTAVRQSHVPGANMAQVASKVDAVRDEYEEACNKVDSIKDNLSIELCNFVAKESEHSSRLVALLEAQAAYHKKALKYVEEAIPKMKQTIEEALTKPLFGMPLEEHLQKMQRDIALVLEACIVTLLETAMEEEGLFRIAGSALKVKKLRASFDAQAIDMEEFTTDPHTVAGVMKQYLRELPEPLLTFNLHSEFMRITTLPQDQRLHALKVAVNKLPPPNYNNLRYLVKFLAELADKSSVNKMTPSNIAIVIGPNLLWAKGETTPNMLTAGAVSAIVEAFIINADDIFPGEVDFHLTGRGCAPPSPSLLAAHSSGKALPLVTISDAEEDGRPEEKKESKPKPEKEGESTLVQIASGEVRDVHSNNSGIMHERGIIDLDHEHEPVMRSPSPSPRAASPVPRAPSPSPKLASTSSKPTPQNSKPSSPGETDDEIWIRRSAAEIDFSATGGYPDSPALEHHHPEPSVSMTASSPAVITYSANQGASPSASYSSSNTGSPLSNNVAAADNLGPSGDSPESSGGHISPKIQRRATKKPAPPPPPERSYNVAVTASVAKPNTGNSGYATMPRLSSHHQQQQQQQQQAQPQQQQAQPQQHQAQPQQHHHQQQAQHPDPLRDSGSHHNASPPERRTSGHERPHGPPPDRPERPHVPPPDRPRVPPSPISSTPPGTPGHQRSASTGAMFMTTTATTSQGPNPDKRITE